MTDEPMIRACPRCGARAMLDEHDMAYCYACGAYAPRVEDLRREAAEKMTPELIRNPALDMPPSEQRWWRRVLLTIGRWINGDYHF